MKRAFSLFELLIVIAIVGILASIGYPTYTKHVAKVHRNHAKAILFEIANQLEESFSMTGHYQSISAPAIADSLPYLFNIHIDKNSYRLSATPKPSQPQFNINECHVLTLDSNGKHCWQN